MNIKALTVRALRASRRHPTATQLGAELRDNLKTIVVLDPQLTHMTAEQVRLCMDDKLSSMVTQGRIYSGGVTRCELLERRIEMDVTIVPNRSIERIVINFNMSA